MSRVVSPPPSCHRFPFSHPIHIQSPLRYLPPPPRGEPPKDRRPPLPPFANPDRDCLGFPFFNLARKPASSSSSSSPSKHSSLNPYTESLPTTPTTTSQPDKMSWQGQCLFPASLPPPLPSPCPSFVGSCFTPNPTNLDRS